MLKNNKSLQDRFLIAEKRRSDFQKAIPKDLDAREDGIRKTLSKENSSSKSKLRKVYNLMAELIEVSEPFTACSKGCSNCCKQNVVISEAEAKFIGDSINKPPVLIHASTSHDINKFLGVPCPFLKNDVCSIYDARPYACRKHFSFDEDDYLCHPSRSTKHQAPMIVFGEAEAAILDIGGYMIGGVFADIRDFFSPPV